MTAAKRVKLLVAAVAAVAILLAAAAGAVFLGDRRRGTSSSPASPAPVATGAAYRDGSYTATGTYLTPQGRESVTLSVTLQDSTVVDTSLQQNATVGPAVEFQRRFASGYKPLVVGKNIDQVSLTRVAGSSLTPAGFTRALEQIKRDAKK